MLQYQGKQKYCHYYKKLGHIRAFPRTAQSVPLHWSTNRRKQTPAMSVIKLGQSESVDNTCSLTLKSNRKLQQYMEMGQNVKIPS